MATQVQSAPGDKPPHQGQTAPYVNASQDNQPNIPVVSNLSYHSTTPSGQGSNLTGISHAFGGILSNNQRRSQYLVLPNGTIVQGIPPPGPFSQPHAPAPESGQPLHYIPSAMYPGFVANAPMIPGTVSAFPWPYPLSGDGSEHSGARHSSWSSGNDGSNNFTPAVDQAGQADYYPAVAPIDRSPAANYLYNTPSPPQVPQSVPYQMMKGSGGRYVLQNIDALLKKDPPIPPAVPAMFTNPNDVTLAKCLENREGITNVYIRGFLPETTDEILHAYASRFGKIDRCKAIVDLDTGLCKGFGFVQFFSFDACENCIRGFFHLGYQASFAQKSRNSRLKDLEDKTSTNIYCTNVPIEWTEADLRRHFHPYNVVSEKISRDEKTGVSKEVGFARFDTREAAEKVLVEFHNVTAKDGIKLLLRFADTKAQKQLKQQSNERRQYRANEYSISVEHLSNGNSPSPFLQRLQQTASHFSPSSQASYHSPLGAGLSWTPATSISPPGPTGGKSSNNLAMKAWSARQSSNPETDTISLRGRSTDPNHQSPSETVSVHSTRTSTYPIGLAKSETSSPHKENIRVGSSSPFGARKEKLISTPKSTI